MNFFLKAAEIWSPEGDQGRLSLASSYYGNLQAFENASADIRFGYGEGLPGQTWAAGQPLLWADLDTEGFLRASGASS